MHKVSYKLKPEESVGCHQTFSSQVGSGHKTTPSPQKGVHKINVASGKSLIPCGACRVTSLQENNVDCSELQLVVANGEGEGGTIEEYRGANVEGVVCDDAVGMGGG